VAAISTGGTRQQLYRAVSGTETPGPYRAVVQLPIGPRVCRVCVHAWLEGAATKPSPRIDLMCPIRNDDLPAGEAAAELRRAAT